MSLTRIKLSKIMYYVRIIFEFTVFSHHLCALAISSRQYVVVSDLTVNSKSNFLCTAYN
jgi:hypothetical protein